MPSKEDCDRLLQEQREVYSQVQELAKAVSNCTDHVERSRLAAERDRLDRIAFSIMDRRTSLGC